MGTTASSVGLFTAARPLRDRPAGPTDLRGAGVGKGDLPVRLAAPEMGISVLDGASRRAETGPAPRVGRDAAPAVVGRPRREPTFLVPSREGQTKTRLVVEGRPPVLPRGVELAVVGTATAAPRRQAVADGGPQGVGETTGRVVVANAQGEAGRPLGLLGPANGVARRLAVHANGHLLARLVGGLSARQTLAVEDVPARRVGMRPVDALPVAVPLADVTPPNGDMGVDQPRPFRSRETDVTRHREGRATGLAVGPHLGRTATADGTGAGLDPLVGVVLQTRDFVSNRFFTSLGNCLP